MNAPAGDFLGGLNYIYTPAQGPVRHHPIIFIHGMWGGAHQFKGWMHIASEAGFPAFAVDLPGHHGSKNAGRWSELSLDYYAKRLLSFCEGVARHGSFNLVGHSMGGLLAQILAARSSYQVKAGVVASAPPRGITAVSGDAFWRMPKYAGPFLFNGELKLNDEDASLLLFNRFDGIKAKELNGTLVPSPGRIAREVVLGTHEVTKDLDVCVIGGKFDLMTPMSVQKRIAEKYGVCAFELPLGHMMMHEPGGEAVMRNLIPWFAGKPARLKKAA